MDPPVAGDEGFLGQVIQDPLLQTGGAGGDLALDGGAILVGQDLDRSDGSGSLGQLSHHHQRLHLQSSHQLGLAHIAAQIEVIGTGLDHIAGTLACEAAVIKGADLIGRALQSQLLTFSRG